MQAQKNMSTIVNTQTIEDVLEKAFSPTELQVIDEGHLHAGHASNGHFRIIIKSAQFNGKTAVQIHRMIYNSLQVYIDCGIHALAIDAKAAQP